jgi:acyl-CoA dehydrogenase
MDGRMETAAMLEPFSRMLREIATPAAVRGIESGGTPDSMWKELCESGYLDALVASDRGGAGLSLADIAPLIEIIGAQAIPLPVAETMVARALLAENGVAAPEGPIVLAPSLAQPVPCSLTASHALVDTGEKLILASLAATAMAGTGVRYSLSARLCAPASGLILPRPTDGLRPIAAVLRSGLIAGAVERLTEMTAAYANERVQFSKPIGKQQVLQQMLAIMAEDMIACRIAARMGLSKGLAPPPTLAATAKITTSIAATRIAASAHAVHGAIGISREHDLQLLVRRLHEWRLADGSEGYWASMLGHARLASDNITLDWVRAEILC